MEIVQIVAALSLRSDPKQRVSGDVIRLLGSLKSTLLATFAGPNARP